MFERMYENRTLHDLDTARGIGWASIGIGLAEIAATKMVQNLLGLDDKPTHRGILRVLGVRELMHGISILMDEKPSAGMKAGVWSRVAGDVLDTALLAAAAKKTKKPVSFWVTASMVLGIGILDTICAKRLTENDDFN